LAYAADRIVWGQRKTVNDEGVEWSWVELLEHLALNWPRLEWEEADPLGVDAPPNRIRFEVEKTWEGATSLVRDHQESVLLEFEEAHNLAAGLSGIQLPELWVLKQGNLCSVFGRGLSLLQPANEVLETLESLGQAVANRLKNNPDERGKKAIAAWDRRRDIPDQKKISIYTGVDRSRLEAVAAGEANFWEQSGEFSFNELMAATRMIGDLLIPSEVRDILAAIRGIPSVDRTKLDDFSAKLPVLNLGPQGRDNANQGYEIAEAFRALIGNKDKPIDPEEILNDLGVPVTNFDLDTDALDAICCWGPAHGPAIFVNPLGRHANSLRGRRFTLAHEICHLLVDRSQTLPLGEVLGGRVPQLVESRASAFASELLLPHQIAGSAFLESKDDKKTLAGLVQRFDIAREVVAWQVYNSGLCANRSTLLFLRRFVSRPMAFLIS
jgi:Zn-dependent peptidase ImmA (M78 family)